MLRDFDQSYQSLDLEESKLVASICRQSFYQFVREFWETIIDEKPIWNWHIKYICDELQAVAERVFLNQPKLYDVIINVPPGSTKSTLVSQMFPAWTWIRMPSARHICASYAHQLSLTHSLFTRDIVMSEKFQKCFPGLIELRHDENTKGLFVNTRKGWRFSTGVRGKVTGYHGHFLLVDDPINPEESYSEKDLRMVNRWMETTLPMRKVEKEVTPLILVMQRLHQADPTGEMLHKMSGKGIKHICIPGELTDDISPPDLKKFYVDGLFDPVRLPRHLFPEMRKILGEYGFAAQILQSPVPLGGSMFKTSFVVLHDGEPPPMVRLCRSWDKAGTPDEGAYSAGVLLGVDKNNEPWVLDCQSGQWGAQEREAMIKQTAILDASGAYAKITNIQGASQPVMIRCEIEPGSGGKESGENTVRNLKGFHIVMYHPTGPKEARAQPFASAMGIRNHVHVLNRPWTKDFLEDYKFFPHGRYKDKIDAGSDAFNALFRQPLIAGGIRQMAARNTR